MREIEVSKEFTFDAAHNLVEYHGKCERLHGHTYRLRVTVKGIPNEVDGMVLDFCRLKSVVNERVLGRLDHAYLNELVKQSSAENLAQWIWDQLYSGLLSESYRLCEVRLWETATSFVTLRGE